MSKEAETFLNAFDKALPSTLDALWKSMQELQRRGRDMLPQTHECDCEFCTIDERDYGILDGYEDAYAHVYAEQQEVIATIQRCVRWAKLKGIKLKKTYDVKRWEKLEQYP